MNHTYVARHQAIQRTIDRVVHHFKVRGRRARKWDDGSDDGYPPKAHYWVRVHLQRVRGWSYEKIERVYAVPVRSAKRWEYDGRGKWALGEGVKRKELDYSDLAKSVLGIDE